MRPSICATALFVLAAMLLGVAGVPVSGAPVEVNDESPTPSPAPSPSSLLPPTIRALLPREPTAPESYAVFLRNAQVHNGLINLIRKDEQLYFDLAPEDFEKTFIIAPSLASGLGAGTYAGRLYDPMLVQFKRVGQRVL